MKFNQILITSVLVLTACSTGTSGDSGASSSRASSEPAAMMIQASSRSSTMEKSSVGSVSSSSSVSGAMEVKSSSALEGESARVIEISAENFVFVPDVIRVKKGEKVTIRLKGAEGIHGFGIADLGVNARVDLGATVDITLPTDTAGTFTFKCTVPCGPGHRDMKGQIIIE